MVSVTRIAIALSILVLTAPAHAQQVSRCASCHFVNMPGVPAPGALSDWARSEHAHQGVSCDRCHGGDPWSDHPAVAHRGVLPASMPDSSVNGANIAATCSACHKANADAFRASVHQTLVAGGVPGAPNCATCHGGMRARKPSPAALEARCRTCHAAGSPSGHYASALREGLETLDALRLRCDRLGQAAKDVRDVNDRLTVMLAVEAARATLKESVAAAHAFSPSTVQERNVATARLLDAVADSLAVSR